MNPANTQNTTNASGPRANEISVPNGAVNPVGSHQVLPETTTAPSTATATPAPLDGRLNETRDELVQRLSNIKSKAPLQQQCRDLCIHFAKSWPTARLREALVSHWDAAYPLPIGGAENSSATPALGHLTSAPPVRSLPDLESIDPRLHPQATPALGPPFELQQTRKHGQAQHGLSSRGFQSHAPQRTTSRDGRHPTEEPDPNDILPDIPNPLTREEAESDLQEQPTAVGADQDALLVEELGIQGPLARQVLDYDAGVDLDFQPGTLAGVSGEGDEEEDEGVASGREESGFGLECRNGDDEVTVKDFDEFKKQTLVGWVNRTEGNRRPGGVRTQKGLVRFWEEFVEVSLGKGEIEDSIVDEHSLLVFIDWCSKRCRRTRRGQDIPGTLIGASQIKKHVFSVLRIRKEQEAKDKTLRVRRPAMSVHVWDAVKTAMDEAVKRVRSGMVGDDEDAPDIIFNTFLDNTTDDELTKIGRGFLMHRELRCCINGHVAWTWQNATGNRGDDVRALKIAELQPYVMLHPNGITRMFCVLALQGEEKAGVKGMQSRVNPSYSVGTGHRNPERDPLGALMMYFHYIWDVRDITKEVKIDWSSNKTWRRIRFLHGRHPEVPFGEQSLLGLYDRAMTKADFKSRIKQHLPRHLMPYRQQDLGVPPDETSKLGWKRGQTYHDVYAPALPKKAILGCHGFKAKEVYDPIWTRVEVPDHFLKMVCPMAERIVELVKGRENLRGATAFWEMIIALRPYMFQSAAAIFKECPSSPIFKLPALAHPEVQAWMKSTFHEQLAVLQAQAGTPALSAQAANSELGVEMQQMVSVMVDSNQCLHQIRHLLERRTAIFSPTRGYSHDVYLDRTLGLLTETGDTTSIPNPPSTPKVAIQVSPEDSRGVYSSPDGFRAFVSDSPEDPGASRPRTQVDLVLPPPRAFSEEGQPLMIIPPVLGLRGVSWVEIFKLIKQPSLLWNVYKPSKTLDGYGTVEGLWSLYALGESLVDEQGTKTGMKPPLQLLEETFGAAWRKDSSARKVWQRFREIPEWILVDSKRRGITASEVVQELDVKRQNDRLGLNALSKQVKVMREECAVTKAIPPHTQMLGGVGDSGQAVQPTKKRRQPLDPRKPSKRAKSGD